MSFSPRSRSLTSSEIAPGFPDRGVLPPVVESVHPGQSWSESVWSHRASQRRRRTVAPSTDATTHPGRVRRIGAGAEEPTASCSRGRLRDPRLNIGCRTEDDEMVGFVWVRARRRARYVSVEQPDYVEVYEVASDLPVRVATRNGVQVEGSRATFDLFEHDANGQLLRRYRLEAAVGRLGDGERDRERRALAREPTRPSAFPHAPRRSRARRRVRARILVGSLSNRTPGLEDPLLLVDGNPRPAIGYREEHRRPHSALARISTSVEEPACRSAFDHEVVECLPKAKGIGSERRQARGDLGMTHSRLRASPLPRPPRRDGRRRPVPVAPTKPSHRRPDARSPDMLQSRARPAADGSAVPSLSP